MINWVIIVIALIVLALIYLKFEHHSKKLKLLIVLVIAVLLVLSLFTVLSNNNTDLTSPRGIVQAGYYYVGWVGQTISGLWDIGVDTTGRVIETIDVNNSTGMK